VRARARASIKHSSDCQITSPHEQFASDPMNLSNIVIKFSLMEEYNVAKEY